jgi:predicted adenylyl cyclase CyaB
MDKDIEIEIRGPLLKKKLEELIRLFKKKGKKIAEKNRILIDYSTFLKGEVKDREQDIRLRVTNGVPEIVVKIGKWSGVDQRRELSVLAKPGDFDTLVEIFAALGFKKGMLCVRKSKVYEYKGIEFALVEVPGHSYYYEAEKLANKKENFNSITKEIKSVCTDLGLKIFNPKQFFQYINQLNREANEVFNYTEYTPNYFEKRFNLSGRKRT